jgi:hypothetical protein
LDAGFEDSSEAREAVWMLVSAHYRGIPSASSLNEASSGTGATWRCKMHIDTKERSDKILYKLYMVGLQKVIFNYWASKMIRQF